MSNDLLDEESEQSEARGDSPPSPRTLIGIARRYIAAGFSVLSVLADGTKRPAGSWSVYQKRKPADGELERWFGDGANGSETRGIGLIHGAVSGNSEALDFDLPGAYEEFLGLCIDHELDGILASCVHVQTPSGGRHVIFRSSGPVAGNTKLAQVAIPEDPAGRDDETMKHAGFRQREDGTWTRIRTKIETRGEGGMTIAPGSPLAVHPTRKPYARISGTFDSVPVLTTEQRAGLLAMAKACNEYGELSQESGGTKQSSKPARPVPLDRADGSIGPGEDFNQRGDPLPILLKAGWQESGRQGEVIHLVRPGKSPKLGISGTLNQIGKGNFWCFSSAASPFENERKYAPFSVYGLLECGGDFKEAARRLAAEGYGDQTNFGATAVNKSFSERKRGGGTRKSNQQSPPGNPGDGDAPGPASDDGGAAAAGIPTPVLRDENGKAEYSGEQVIQILDKSGWGAAVDSHAAHAYRIVEHLGTEVAYCPRLGWILWNGKNWVVDEKDATATAARVVPLSKAVRCEAARLYEVVALLTRAGEYEKSTALVKAAKKHQTHSKAVESTPFIAASMHLAAGLLTVPIERFEPTPWVIGFQNGVWDCGEWRAHRREDYMLSLSPVTVPEADTDEFTEAWNEWSMVLNRITGGDADLARTMQETFGYAFCGASHMRILPWLYGPKGSGKSTISELAMTVLGDGLSASVAPSDLGFKVEREKLGAKIWGKRLVVCPEIGNAYLDTELLKTLSGGDRLPVRFLYKQAFTAKPSHMMLLVANDPPSMDAYDDALRDRIMAVPCKHRLNLPDPILLSGGARIEEVRQNPDSLLVKGFTLWVLDGLTRLLDTQAIFRAKAVTTATADFWAATDPLTDFWTGVDAADLEAGIDKGRLRTLYEAWCTAEGVKKPLGRVQWASACRARGLTEGKNNAIRFWRLSPDLKLAGLDATPTGQTGHSSGNSDKVSYEDNGPSREFYSKNDSSVPFVPLDRDEDLNWDDELEGLSDPFDD